MAGVDQKETHVIMGVHITDRLQKATDVQKLFTEYGSIIKTRLGLHQMRGDVCVAGGVLLLEIVHDETKADELADKLNALEGVEVKKMTFDHPAG